MFCFLLPKRTRGTEWEQSSWGCQAPTHLHRQQVKLYSNSPFSSIKLSLTNPSCKCVRVQTWVTNEELWQQRWVPAPRHGGGAAHCERSSTPTAPRCRRPSHGLCGTRRQPGKRDLNKPPARKREGKSFSCHQFYLFATPSKPKEITSDLLYWEENYAESISLQGHKSSKKQGCPSHRDSNFAPPWWLCVW